MLQKVISPPAIAMKIGRPCQPKALVDKPPVAQRQPQSPALSIGFRCDSAARPRQQTRQPLEKLPNAFRSLVQHVGPYASAQPTLVGAVDATALFSGSSKYKSPRFLLSLKALLKKRRERDRAFLGKFVWMESWA